MIAHSKACLAGLLVLSALLGGCPPPEEESTPDYFTPSPAGNTPTPTASPTPTATEEPTPDLAAGYRMTSLTLEESDGVDLDGKSGADNDYADTLEGVADTISSDFVDACVAALEGVELPEQVPTDNTTVLCRSVSAAIITALGGFINLEEMNLNIEEGMATTEYLERFEPLGDENLALEYYFGTAEDGIYYLGDMISRHQGPLSSNGAAKLGPGSFTLALELGDPVLIPMELIKARTELTWTPETVTNAKLGGVLTEEALIDTLMLSLANVVPLPEPVLNKVGDALGRVIPDCGTEDTVMEDCDDLGGIAMGFTFQVESVVLE